MAEGGTPAAQPCPPPLPPRSELEDETKTQLIDRVVRLDSLLRRQIARHAKVIQKCKNTVYTARDDFEVIAAAADVREASWRDVLAEAVPEHPLLQRFREEKAETVDDAVYWIPTGPGKAVQEVERVVQEAQQHIDQCADLAQAVAAAGSAELTSLLQRSAEPADPEAETQYLGAEADDESLLQAAVRRARPTTAGTLLTQERLARGGMELAQHGEWVRLLEAEDKDFEALHPEGGPLLPQKQPDGEQLTESAQSPSEGACEELTQRSAGLPLARDSERREGTGLPEGQHEERAASSAGGGVPPLPLQDEPIAGRRGPGPAQGPAELEGKCAELGKLLARERRERGSAELAEREGWVELMRQEDEAYEGLRQGSSPGTGLLEKPQRECGPACPSGAKPEPPCCPPGAEDFIPLERFMRLQESPLTMRVTGKRCPTLQCPQRAEHRGKRTVVLDLDETLVHWWKGSADWPEGIAVRRGARELLRKLAQNFEVLVWTAGVNWYARKMCTLLDPEGLRISHLVYRHRVWFKSPECYEKNLQGLPRRLKRVILVDNSPCCAATTNKNTLLIPDYDHVDKVDDDLAGVEELLLSWTRGQLSAAAFLERHAAVVPVDTGRGTKRVPHLRQPDPQDDAGAQQAL